MCCFLRSIRNSEDCSLKPSGWAREMMSFQSSVQLSCTHSVSYHPPFSEIAYSSPSQSPTCFSETDEAFSQEQSRVIAININSTRCIGLSECECYAEAGFCRSKGQFHDLSGVFVICFRDAGVCGIAVPGHFHGYEGRDQTD